MILSDAVQEKQRRIFAEAHIRQTMIDAAGRKLAEDMPHWSHWYLLAVRSGYEQRVADVMGEHGVHVWLPTIAKKKCCRRGRGHRRSLVEIRTALFPGFVLVRIVPSAHAWHGLMSFDHVLGLIGPDCESWQPMLLDSNPRGHVSLRFVERVRLMESAEFVNLSTDRWTFKVGMKVTVIDGPFSGLLGVVSNKRAVENMIWVEVNVFGRATPMQLFLDQIEKRA